MANIKAIIFDMDGLLIDSEPFWQQSEKEIFKSVGIELTTPMCLETVGYRIDEVVEYWYQKIGWKENTLREKHDALVKGIIARVKELILEKGKAKEGVYDLLEHFKKEGLPMAVASSSYFELIEATVTSLNIKSYFEILHSAEAEEYGKPHPAVFISAAKKLGVAPEHCIVFEDSLMGVIAGRAAKMTTIAVPEIDKPEFIIAHRKLKSLKDFL